MRKFIDEEGRTITEDELYDEWYNDPDESTDDMTFEEYILNCTDKNGTLTEIKNS